jgi:hypothetical protein
MSYPNNEWVKQFLAGKTIEQVISNNWNQLHLRFTDGSSFEAYGHAQLKREGSAEIRLQSIIVTPFDRDGNVVQTTAIMAQAVPDVRVPYIEDGIFSNFVYFHVWGTNTAWCTEKYPAPIEFVDCFRLKRDLIDRVVEGARKAGHHFYIEWPPAK